MEFALLTVQGCMFMQWYENLLLLYLKRLKRSNVRANADDIFHKKLNMLEEKKQLLRDEKYYERQDFFPS
jgi:hypothetical protein